MTRRLRGALAAAAATTCVAALPAAPAHAAVSFSDAETVATSMPMMPGQVNDLAVGGDGTVGVVAWTMTGTTVAVRDAGGDFGTPLPITSMIPGIGGDIAFDDAGNAILVASEVGGLTWRRRPRGGAWSTPQPLAPLTSTPDPVTPSRVVQQPDGTAVAIYRTMDAKIEAVTAPPGAGFGSATVLAPASEAPGAPLTLTAGPGGRLLATWQSSATTLRARLFRNGAWGPAATLGTRPAGLAPSVSFRRDGAIDIVWAEQSIAPSTVPPGMLAFNGVVRGVTRSATGSAWSAIDVLDDVSGTMFPPFTTADVAGGTAVWAYGGAGVTEIRRASAGGAGFAAASPLATGAAMAPVQGAQIEQLADGRRLVTWVEGTTMRYLVLRSNGAEEARGTVPGTSSVGPVLTTDPVNRTGAIAFATGDFMTGQQLRVMSIDDPAPPSDDNGQTPPPSAGDQTPLPAPPAQSASRASVADAAAPILDRVRLSRSRFRVGSQPTALGAAKRKKTPTGSELTWLSSEAGRVRIDVERTVRGYKSGRRCVTKKPKKASGKVKRCSLVELRGTFVRENAAGENRLRFSGRIGKRALPSGTYKLAIIAVDDAGNRSAVKRVAFTVVKR